MSRISKKVPRVDLSNADDETIVGAAGLRLEMTTTDCSRLIADADKGRLIADADGGLLLRIYE